MVALKYNSTWVRPRPPFALGRYKLSISAFGRCILPIVSNFLVLVSSFLIFRRFPVYDIKTVCCKWYSHGANGFHSVASITFALYYQPNSSVVLLSYLLFCCSVLNAVSFVHPQVCVSSFLLQFFDGDRVVDMNIASNGKAIPFEGGFGTLFKAKLHLHVTAKCLHDGEEILLLLVL